MFTIPPLNDGGRNLQYFMNFRVLFFSADPTFTAPIVNVTVPVGRDAFLTCKVHDLVAFKVSPASYFPLD